jgi:hypothetical protein
MNGSQRKFESLDTVSSKLCKNISGPARTGTSDPLVQKKRSKVKLSRGGPKVFSNERMWGFKIEVAVSFEFCVCDYWWAGCSLGLQLVLQLCSWIYSYCRSSFTDEYWLVNHIWRRWGGLATYRCNRTGAPPTLNFVNKSTSTPGERHTDAELFQSAQSVYAGLRDKYDFQRPWGIASSPATDRLELLGSSIQCIAQTMYRRRTNPVELERKSRNFVECPSAKIWS